MRTRLRTADGAMFSLAGGTLVSPVQSGFSNCSTGPESGVTYSVRRDVNPSKMPEGKIPKLFRRRILLEAITTIVAGKNGETVVDQGRSSLKHMPQRLLGTITESISVPGNACRCPTGFKCLRLYIPRKAKPLNAK